VLKIKRMALRKHFLAFSFLIFSINLFSQHKTTPAQEVGAVMKIQEKAWNNFDIDGFMLYYWNNDSLMFVGSKGITYGWKQTLANYKKNYASKELMGELTFTNASYETLSKTAVHVVGKWQIKRKDTQIGGYYSLLWKKIDGKWVIVRDHTS
jgi:ketosteroid isomerase-like protein